MHYSCGNAKTHTEYLDDIWDLVKSENGVLFLFKYQLNNKLDGVGPVDNRPSPDKLQYFVKKKKSDM